MRIEDRPALRLKLCPPRGREGHGDVGIAAVYALFALREVEDAGTCTLAPATPPSGPPSFLSGLPADCFAPGRWAPPGLT
jgi:hypothetical protein